MCRRRRQRSKVAPVTGRLLSFWAVEPGGLLDLAWLDDNEQ